VVSSRHSCIFRLMLPPGGIIAAKHTRRVDSAQCGKSIDAVISHGLVMSDRGDWSWPGRFHPETPITTPGVRLLSEFALYRAIMDGTLHRKGVNVNCWPDSSVRRAGRLKMLLCLYSGQPLLQGVTFNGGPCVGRAKTIANLGMPPMTMIFKAVDPALLEELKVCDSIEFFGRGARRGISLNRWAVGGSAMSIAVWLGPDMEPRPLAICRCELADCAFTGKRPRDMADGDT